MEIMIYEYKGTEFTGHQYSIKIDDQEIMSIARRIIAEARSQKY